MSKAFNDKVVLVTGASRGIGRATALAFARTKSTVGHSMVRNRCTA